jgi:hypothetical protein
MKKLANHKTKTDKPLNPKRRPVGRPNGSRSVRIVPVFRDEIDVQKLGRAALRLIMIPSNNTTNNERTCDET